jgi:hypothetical protein
MDDKAANQTETAAEEKTAEGGAEAKNCAEARAVTTGVPFAPGVRRTLTGVEAAFYERNPQLAGAARL